MSNASMLCLHYDTLGEVEPSAYICGNLEKLLGPYTHIQYRRN
jgi:hypothetical protein